MKYLICVGLFVLAGCANSTRLSEQPRYNEDGSRSYSQEVLQKTGQQTPGDALSRVDPSVSVSHR